MALKFLASILDLPQTKKYITDEQRATHAYLTAKCHAKLHHNKEAMNALGEIAEIGTDTGNLLDDEDFEELADIEGPKFQAIASTIRSLKRQECK